MGRGRLCLEGRGGSRIGFSRPEHDGEALLLKLSFRKVLPLLETGRERKQGSWPGVTEMAEAELRHTVLYLMPAYSVCGGGASEGRVEAKIWHTCTLLANLGSWCHPESAKKGKIFLICLPRGILF